MDKPKIVKFPSSEPLPLVSERLRELADSIDAGEYGMVDAGVLVLTGNHPDVTPEEDVRVFALGEVDAPLAHLLLHVGAHRFVRSVLRG